MNTQPPKKLSLKDCKIDWKHYPLLENGKQIIVDNTHLYQELLEECECNEIDKADKEVCSKYFLLDYDYEKIQKWMIQKSVCDDDIAILGLYKMFDDGWIKSPAFVDWKQFDFILHSRGLYIFDRTKDIEYFIQHFQNPEVRVSILKYFKNNINFIIKEKDVRKYMLPAICNSLNIHTDAAKLYKEELKQKEKAEKAKNKTPKEKPEYILSIDEIINYVREENPESAYAIRGMLRFFAMEKSGWSTTAVKKRIEQISQQTLIQQTNFNGPVGQNVQEQHVDTLTAK
jgi:hypothetical protein